MNTDADAFVEDAMGGEGVGVGRGGEGALGGAADAELIAEVAAITARRTMRAPLALTGAWITVTPDVVVAAATARAIADGVVAMTARAPSAAATAGMSTT